QVCGALRPAVLGYAWLPREARREAVRGLYRLGDRCPHANEDEVRHLLETDICQRPSGNLDLWAVGGILHLLPSEPYRRLQEWVGTERIVASFLEDIEASAPFLALHDGSPRGRRYLIGELSRHTLTQRAAFLASLAQVVQADALDFLDPLDGKAACQVFEVLLERTAPQPLPPPPPRNGEGEKLAVSGSPSPFRGGGWGEGLRQALSARKGKRVGEILGRKIAAGYAGPFLRAWLKLPAPEEFDLGLHVLRVVSRTLDAKPLLHTALGLEPETLRKFLTTMVWCAGFPYDKEIELARGLAAHPDVEVRAWATLRLAVAPPAPVKRKAGGRKKDGRLPATALRTLAHCDDAELAAALEGCQPGLRVGLCEALVERPEPTTPHLTVCAALLASHDPIAAVVEQFRRFGSTMPEFVARLDEEMAESWRGEEQLPLLGHAWLYRWEGHAQGLLRRLKEWPAGTAAALRLSLSWPVQLLAQRVWDGLEFLIGLWRWRDGYQLRSLCTDEFGQVLVDAVATPFGPTVAAILMRLREHGTVSDFVEGMRDAVRGRLLDATYETRNILMPWIDTHGMAPTVESLFGADPVAPAAAPASPSGPATAEIAATEDLDRLATWCCSEVAATAEAAAQRLLALHDTGISRLAGLVRTLPRPPHVVTLARILATAPALDALRESWDVLQDPSADPQARFALGLALLKRHKPKVKPHLFDAICRGTPKPWFQAKDWDRLVAAGLSARQLALGLATSPQPHAYSIAVEHLLKAPLGSAVRHALVAFLEAGANRTYDLRRRVAEKLVLKTDAVLPLLLLEEGRTYPKRPHLLREQPPQVVEAVVAMVLTVGAGLFAEEYLLDFLNQPGVDPDARDEAYRRLLLDANSVWVKQEVVRRLEPTLARNRLLRRVAATFAWGVEAARELTGKLFGVEMIGGEDLGYTRFEQNRIYINPLPILRGEMLGRQVVEGLIVHELGHHMYHRGPEPQEIWREAQDSGLHPLLNLTADEHLERNLRARDSEHGDRLKRLAAYAFQHSQRDIAVETLLDALQAKAFSVLTATRLEVARRWGCVSVDSGHVLHEIEKTGLSFARFVRALRMGLGNRHRDPKVAEGLALFRGKFRRSTMRQLMTIARRLREIFGWETDLLNALGQEFALSAGEADLLAEGQGISNADVQTEVRRILDTSKAEKKSTTGKGGSGLNLSPEEAFHFIETVKQVPYDPVSHAELARQVARPARHMKRYFEQLGLALEPERFRLRGKSFDRSRSRAVVLRGDPRMLIARQAHIRTDLFIGVVIDCSGSMQHGSNMTKAKLFGALLAEAAKDTPGVDLRVFGFTDQVIYDAGTAKRCAVHGLEANGGNNDAAGLWHAAQVARSSHRKAKLLVMISDGLPTECSVAALRGLVGKLT
ncbi:MAG TPA: hypothetical protein VEL76_23110, partial [Gemmataceae bacterium]|nr:hypothetical protein [Gemmataceae bacterium]